MSVELLWENDKFYARKFYYYTDPILLFKYYAENSESRVPLVISLIHLFNTYKTWTVF